MKTTESIASLAAALAAAQGEFVSPERNRTVAVRMKNDKGEYSFTYATFDTVCDMARPILSKHGLAVVQAPSVGESELIVTTRLMHASGEWIEEAFAITTASADPQALGSLLTYMKRYSYCSMLGITAEEDDDGNAATGNEIGSSSARGPREVCPKCGKPAFKDKEKENAFYCWKKKDGCGHTWTKGEAVEPPKNGTGTKKAEPTADPFEAAKSAVAKAEWSGLSALADRCAASDKLNRDQKIELLNLIATRGMTDAPQDAEPTAIEDIVRKTTGAIKELDHTFA